MAHMRSKRVARMASSDVDAESSTCTAPPAHTLTRAADPPGGSRHSCHSCLQSCCMRSCCSETQSAPVAAHACAFILLFSLFLALSSLILFAAARSFIHCVGAVRNFPVKRALQLQQQRFSSSKLRNFLSCFPNLNQQCSAKRPLGALQQGQRQA